MAVPEWEGDGGEFFGGVVVDVSGVCSGVACGAHLSPYVIGQELGHGNGEISGDVPDVAFLHMGREWCVCIEGRVDEDELFEGRTLPGSFEQNGASIGMAKAYVSTRYVPHKVSGNLEPFVSDGVEAYVAIVMLEDLPAFFTTREAKSTHSARASITDIESVNEVQNWGGVNRHGVGGVDQSPVAASSSASSSSGLGLGAFLCLPFFPLGMPFNS